MTPPWTASRAVPNGLGTEELATLLEADEPLVDLELLPLPDGLMVLLVPAPFPVPAGRGTDADTRSTVLTSVASEIGSVNVCGWNPGALTLNVCGPRLRPLMVTSPLPVPLSCPSTMMSAGSSVLISSPPVGAGAAT